MIPLPTPLFMEAPAGVSGRKLKERINSSPPTSAQANAAPMSCLRLMSTFPNRIVLFLRRAMMPGFSPGIIIYDGVTPFCFSSTGR